MCPYFSNVWKHFINESFVVEIKIWSKWQCHHTWLTLIIITYSATNIIENKKNIQFKVFFNNIFCKTDIYIFMKFKIHHPKKSFTVLRHTLCWNKLLLKVIVLHKKTFFSGFNLTKVSKAFLLKYQWQQFYSLRIITQNI